jgi:hypothetical protein
MAARIPCSHFVAENYVAKRYFWRHNSFAGVSLRRTSTMLHAWRKLRGARRRCFCSRKVGPCGGLAALSALIRKRRRLDRSTAFSI